MVGGRAGALGGGRPCRTLNPSRDTSTLTSSPDIKGISHLSQGAWLGTQASPSFLHRPLEASWGPGGRDSS